VLQRITRKSGISLGEVSNGGQGNLQERLCKSLPAELRSHIFEVILRPGEMVVFTESAAWAGRLRLALAELRQGSSQALPELATHARLTLRVTPHGGYRR
jgi:hypothetical protein